MAFGKPGRPSDDPLARQHEIYVAVSPLILTIGARRLSMRQAAQAACLSVGGLYHHFATKQELVLHGIQPATITRCCMDFHAGAAELARSNPPAYLERSLDFLTDMVGFIRPSVCAALELRLYTLEATLAPTLAAANEEFAVSFRVAVPAAADADVAQVGRSLHRALVAALFDRSITQAELRGELTALLNGYLALRQVHAPGIGAATWLESAAAS
ncbi:MAG: TetR/AcrR family transcriptional regulator [Anaerolineae bacterium]